jgi:glycosyltransferase involved in cell wall biosynthesis
MREGEGMTESDIPMARQKRPSVIFVINSLAGGGAERVMTTLLKASQDKNAAYELRLVLLDQEPATYDVPSWVKIDQLDCRHSLVRSVMRIMPLLRNHRPQAVLSFLTRANIAAIISCRLLGIPVVISERVNTSSHFGEGTGAALAKFMVRLIYPRARRIIAVSPGVANDLRQSFDIPEKKIAVIANPIDRAEITRQADVEAAPQMARPFVMAMGRLVPNKNFSMLISAYHRSGISADLIILGEGPERDRLLAQIKDLGLVGRVHLPGFSGNPFAILRLASAFILPSNAEGFPNSLLEAMSLGIPVISTNCLSGPSEVLADLPRESIAPGVVLAEYGIIVPPDQADDMAAALKVMMTPECHARYGAKARERAGDFSVERAQQAYWRTIEAEMAPSNDGDPLKRAEIVSR